MKSASAVSKTSDLSSGGRDSRNKAFSLSVEAACVDCSASVCEEVDEEAQTVEDDEGKDAAVSTVLVDGSKEFVNEEKSKFIVDIDSNGLST